MLNSIFFQTAQAEDPLFKETVVRAVFRASDRAGSDQAQQLQLLTKFSATGNTDFLTGSFLFPFSAVSD